MADKCELVDAYTTRVQVCTTHNRREAPWCKIENLEAQLSQAKADLAKARAELDETLNGVADTVLAAQARAERAEAEVVKQIRYYDAEVSAHIETQDRALKSEALAKEQERAIAELAEERDEYFSVVGYSRTSEFREKLAALCHEQWSGWMKHLFSKCLPGWDNPKELVVPAWAVERWSRQLTASYDELSETEKDSDREEADRILFLFSPNPAKEDGK